ncbi:MAG: hypothetical protein KCHDKBKB_00249 [Elusimicrobia bacterium]|nr:hypothetical protein [Elusimicrobiota bacterium]
MNPLMMVILAFFTLLVGLWLLPLWVLVRGDMFKSLSFSEKSLLALKMARSWPLSHYFFVMGVSKKALFLLLSVVLLVVSLFVVRKATRFFNFTIKKENQNYEGDLPSMEGITFTDLTDEEISKFKSLLIQSSLWSKEKSKYLKIILEDGDVNSVEYQRWIGFSLETTSAKNLEKLQDEPSIMIAIFQERDKQSPVIAPKSGNPPTQIEAVPSSPEQKFEITYFPEGGLRSVCTVENGLKNGWARYYRRDGTVYFETTYANGIEQGMRKVYSSNEEIIAQVNMVNGEALPPVDPHTSLQWWKEELISTIKAWGQ